MPSRKESQSADELLGNDHAALDKLLKGLFAALDKAEIPAVFEHLDFFWARLAMHIRAENLHLFPAILSRLEDTGLHLKDLPPPAEALAAIAQLQADHDFFMHELAAAIKAVRRLKNIGHSERESHTLDEVAASITAISKQLESHNRIEEKLVYGLPAKLLTPSEQRTLAAGIERELQNLPPRFNGAQVGA